MVLHEQKFELIVHRSNPESIYDNLPFSSENYMYKVSEQVLLTPVYELRDLGIGVSSSLSWTQHINDICTKARNVSSWVLSVFKSRDTEVMMTLYKSLIRSHLEYCCPLWHPHLLSDIEKLEGVQRAFTSRLLGCRDLSYWERLKLLNIMSLQRRRERYIVLYVWKVLHRKCPNNLGITFRPPSRLGVQAVIPGVTRGSKASIQTLYDASYADDCGSKFVECASSRVDCWW